MSVKDAEECFCSVVVGESVFTSHTTSPSPLPPRPTHTALFDVVLLVILKLHALNEQSKSFPLMARFLVSNLFGKEKKYNVEGDF